MPCQSFFLNLFFFLTWLEFGGPLCPASSFFVLTFFSPSPRLNMAALYALPVGGVFRARVVLALPPPSLHHLFFFYEYERQKQATSHELETKKPLYA
jgi:hypothetical protein